MLKTLLSLASTNAAASASSKKNGMDAQMRTRTVLYPDEPVDLPRWGISALPSMILGAAPQTCLFVKDLTVMPAKPDQDTDGRNSPATPSKSPTSTASPGTTDDSTATPDSDTVSFSLALDSPPETESGLSARQITWQLSMPVAGYRDIKTSANSDSVRTPVIRTCMQLRGIDRDVEIGLLEMAGIEQPLLIGQDTLGDKFLIRPDRSKTEKTAKSPSVNLAPAPAEDAKDDKDATETASGKAPAATTPSSDQTAAAPDALNNAPPTSPEMPETASDAKGADTPAPNTTTPTNNAPPSTPTPESQPAPATTADQPAIPDTTPPAATTTTDATPATSTATPAPATPDAPAPAPEPEPEPEPATPDVTPSEPKPVNT
ncbi:hypothetical protein [Thalassospira sp. GB04J01]|uniref:hypothetical protein n=1 Tax=Thalassospira sp. GB04J01 TaxID=1485225 RepID=UPI000C99BD07|nr:hypothetical protein [Thalassospira sp. GB04J01]